MYSLFSIAACVVALFLAGCDGDTPDAETHGAKLWDAPYVRALSLPEMVDSAIASGQMDSDAEASSAAPVQAGDSSDPGTGAPMQSAARDEERQPADETAPPHAPELPLRGDPALASIGGRSVMASACCGIGIIDEMPRYDWALDMTDAADADDQ